MKEGKRIWSKDKDKKEVEKDNQQDERRKRNGVDREKKDIRKGNQEEERRKKNGVKIQRKRKEELGG